MYYLLSLLLVITSSELPNSSRICEELRVELDIAVKEELLTIKEATEVYNRCAGRRGFDYYPFHNHET